MSAEPISLALLRDSLGHVVAAHATVRMLMRPQWKDAEIYQALCSSEGALNHVHMELMRACARLLEQANAGGGSR